MVTKSNIAIIAMQVGETDPFSGAALEKAVIMMSFWWGNMLTGVTLTRAEAVAVVTRLREALEELDR